MGHTFNREVYKVGAYDDTFRCPVCDGTIILSEVNSVSAMRPELTALWSAENEMSPDETFYNRQSLVLWNCQECHGTYPMKISDKTPDNTDCPYCNNIKLLPAFNDLRIVYPELASEWSSANPDKPSEYLRTSPHKALWACPTCHGEYVARICDRFVNDCVCPYCNEKKVLPGFNSFAAKHPDEMEEWDELANYLLADPDEILSSYNQKLWWNCPQGHKYDMSPKQKLYYRMRKMQPCPYCKGRRRKLHHFF